MMKPTILTRFRQWLAFKIYKPPAKSDEGPGWLSTRGIFEYALDTKVKREIVRKLAYHFGRRVYYDEDESRSTGLGVISDYALSSKSFPVSTDKTDYENQKEYWETVEEAKKTEISKVLEELVEAKVVKVYINGEFTLDYSFEEDGIPEGVDLGPRFEYAAQALKWADMIGSEYTWEEYSI